MKDNTEFTHAFRDDEYENYINNLRDGRAGEEVQKLETENER